MAFGKTSCSFAERFLIWHHRVPNNWDSTHIQITDSQKVGIQQLIFTSQSPKSGIWLIVISQSQLICIYKGKLEQIVKRLKMGFHNDEQTFVYSYCRNGSARTRTNPIMFFVNQSFQNDSQNKAIVDSCWPEHKDIIRASNISYDVKNKNKRNILWWLHDNAYQACY